MKNLYYSVFTLLLLALFACPDILLAQRAVTPAPSAVPCPVPPGKLSLTDVIELLRKVDGKVLTFPCIADAIRKQGTTFERTPTVVETLGDYAATPGIIDAILPPSPPPPVVAKVAGTLTVDCSSPECEVFIEGFHKTTTSGKTDFPNLTPGKFPLVVYKDGFKLYSAEIELLDGVPKTLPLIQLQQIPPDPAIPALKLKATLWDILAPTGAIEAIDGLGTLKWTGDDKNSEWSVPKLARNAGKDLDITFKNSAGECKLKITGEVPKPLTCAGKLKNDPKVEVVVAAKLFLKFELHDIVSVLLAREVVRPEGSSARLQTLGGPDSYTLTLNDKGLPAMLEYQFQNSQWSVQYSDYKLLGRSQYPMRMSIEEAGTRSKWEFVMSSVLPR